MGPYEPLDSLACRRSQPVRDLLDNVHPASTPNKRTVLPALPTPPERVVLPTLRWCEQASAEVTARPLHSFCAQALVRVWQIVHGFFGARRRHRPATQLW